MTGSQLLGVVTRRYKSAAADSERGAGLQKGHWHEPTYREWKPRCRQYLRVATAKGHARRFGWGYSSIPSGHAAATSGRWWESVRRTLNTGVTGVGDLSGWFFWGCLGQRSAHFFFCDNKPEARSVFFTMMRLALPDARSCSKIRFSELFHRHSSSVFEQSGTDILPQTQVETYHLAGSFRCKKAFLHTRDPCFADISAQTYSFSLVEYLLQFVQRAIQLCRYLLCLLHTIEI